MNFSVMDGAQAGRVVDDLMPTLRKWQKVVGLEIGEAVVVDFCLISLPSG